MFPTEMKYAYSETESCASSRFPGSDLRGLSQSNLSVARRNPPLTTTDYGFIDLPFANLRPSSRSDHCGLDDEGRSSISPTSSDFAVKKLARDTSSTFSHDSGVDSMNTNSSGWSMPLCMHPPHQTDNTSPISRKCSVASNAEHQIRDSERLRIHSRPEKLLLENLR